MIRAVLDVNVFVGCAINKDSRGAQILARIGEYISFTTEKILDDLLRVMHYDRIRSKHKMTDDEIVEFIKWVRKQNAVLPGLVEITVVHEDPDDDVIVACAIEAMADYIVSADHHLLDLKHYREIQIVAPAAFLDILDREKAFRIN